MQWLDSLESIWAWNWSRLNACSTLGKGGDGGTSLTVKAFEAEWNQYVNALKSKNEENINSITAEAKGYALRFADETVENAITRLILLLYKYETEELELDLIKCIVMEPDYSPSHEERCKLLRWLWQNIKSTYHGYDFSVLLDRVREINKTHKALAEAGEDVPFV